MAPRALLRAAAAPIAVILASSGCSNDYTSFELVAAGGSGSTTTAGPGGGDGTGATSSASTTSGAGGIGTSSGGAGTGASSGGAGTGGANSGAGGGTAGAGGSGGAVDTCGDGKIDPGEECDPGPGPTKGCSPMCEVECDGDGEVYDPMTHHCYYRDLSDMARTWNDARTFCQTTWGGGDLLVLETIQEYNFLLMSLPLPKPPDYDFFFVGASDSLQEGVWLWIDGTQVAFAFYEEPWMTNPAQPNGNGNCMVWRADQDPDAEGLGDLDCAELHHPFCERAPPGSP